MNVSLLLLARLMYKFSYLNTNHEYYDHIFNKNITITTFFDGHTRLYAKYIPLLVLMIYIMITRALDRRGHSLSQHTQFLKNNMIDENDFL